MGSLRLVKLGLLDLVLKMSRELCLCLTFSRLACVNRPPSDKYLLVKLYVLGGFDWNNQPVHASEVYDSETDEWKAIENTGHPQLSAPQWFKKDWRPEWQDIVLHNSSYFCSYTEADGRAFVKEYDPETGNWKLRRPKLKALLRWAPVYCTPQRIQLVHAWYQSKDKSYQYT